MMPNAACVVKYVPPGLGPVSSRSRLRMDRLTLKKWCASWEVEMYCGHAISVEREVFAVRQPAKLSGPS